MLLKQVVLSQIHNSSVETAEWSSDLPNDHPSFRFATQIRHPYGFVTRVAKIQNPIIIK